MEKKKHMADSSRPNVISISMDATFFFERAVRSLDRYHYEKALKYFRRAVDFEPDNPVNQCNMAGVLSEMGQYAESNAILRHVLEEIDPSMTECHFYMANNYANMEDFEAAEKAVIRYLETDASGQFLEDCEEMLDMLAFELERPVQVTTIKSREGLFEHDKARSLLENGRFVEAVRMLQRLIKKNPDFTAARNNLALAYYYMGQFEKAMETIDAVLESDPGNLHALCNLAIFYQHKGLQEPLARMTDRLRKTYPYQPDHLFKLATTMGILGEHQAALRLFRRLLKLEDAAADPCLLHYAAVAAFNIGRPEEAKRLWQQAEKLDPASEIPRFYLNRLSRGEADRMAPPISYHYHLPFEEQFRLLEKTADAIPDYLKKDPLVRSSFFWALRHGDNDTKLQVIQAFGIIADNEVEEALKQFILEPEEDDYLKKVAFFVLRSLGADGPHELSLSGRAVTVPSFPLSPNLPAWDPKWQKVLELALDNMRKRYDMVQQHDLETLWVEYLSRIYPQLPPIVKLAGWAAALEYLTAKMHRRAISYEEVSQRYDISVSTVRKNVRLIDTACGLKEKMDAIFPKLVRAGIADKQ